jgi:hypothetical protein
MPTKAEIVQFLTHEFPQTNALLRILATLLPRSNTRWGLTSYVRGELYPGPCLWRLQMLLSM